MNDELRPPLLHHIMPVGSWRRWLAVWLGVPLLLLIAGLVIADQFVMPIMTRQGSEFKLPDFTNERMVDAQITLHELDLADEVASREFTPGTPQGVILSQYPVGGTMVKPGRTIKFVVSAGQKMVAIPDLAGRSVRQAMLDLESVGLKLGEIAWAYSDTVPERVVVFSYPSEGSEIPVGSQVNLMVNRGRVSTYTFVPRLAGMTLDDAKKELAAKALRAGNITYRKDDTYLPDTVLEQLPEAGSEVDVNAEIDLVVSSS